MYKIHHTEGLILSCINVGEADKYLSIFTKELGLVRVQAQGIRKLSSKLRYHVQDFSYARINLVQGREIWRLTNATKIKSFDKVIQNQYAFDIFINVTRLLGRLVAGEEKNEPLFLHLIDTFSFLDEENLTREELRDTELIIVFRILHHLGYIGVEKEKGITSSFIDRTLLESIRPKRETLLSEINKSLKETQL